MTLISFAAHLAGGTEEASFAFGAFGRELGVAFQITDDCLDLVGTEAEVGKSLGTDLLGGKMTLPLIMLRSRLEGAPRQSFDRVISEGVVSPDDITAIADLLRVHGVVDDALARAREHVATGVAGLSGYVSDEAYVTLEAIGAFVLSRTL